MRRLRLQSDLQGCPKEPDIFEAGPLGCPHTQLLLIRETFAVSFFSPDLYLHLQCAVTAVHRHAHRSYTSTCLERPSGSGPGLLPETDLDKLASSVVASCSQVEGKWQVLALAGQFCVKRLQSFICKIKFWLCVCVSQGF